MQKISERVYWEPGVRGCNVTVVVTGEGLVMIDTPMIAEDAARMKKEMAALGELKYIINTEPHMDHFAGNTFFSVPVIGHEGAREAVLSAPLSQYKEMLGRSSPEAAAKLTSFNFRPPTITLSQRLTLHLGGITFKVANMPGHSPFQVPVLIVEEKVLCTSDNVVNGSMAFLHQALPEAWLETLKRYEQMDAKVLVPGHGNICDKTRLPEMAKMIKSIVDAVKDAVAKGLKSEQAQASISLAQLFPNLGSNPFMANVLKMNIAHLYEIYAK
jgi:cyclase